MSFYPKPNEVGLGVSIDQPNSKTKGDVTEAMVIYELASRGYAISIPFGDNQKYDLIVDDDGALHRIQCKTAWTTSFGTIRFNTHSQTTRGGEYHQTTYFGDIDAFAVWYPTNRQMYWIDINDAPASQMDLRYDACIDHPSINWAEEFELGEEIPVRE